VTSAVIEGWVRGLRGKVDGGRRREGKRTMAPPRILKVAPVPRVLSIQSHTVCPTPCARRRAAR